MNPRLVAKLDRLIDRRAEVEAELAAPGATADPDAFRRLSQEYAALDAVTQAASAQKATEEELQGLEEMARDADPELRAMAAAERPALNARLETLESQLAKHLAPKDPFDDHSLFLEIRAGTGGDEAAIFAGNLYRMYARYIENAGWTLEVLSESPGEHGGYREIITRVNGYGAYGRLKFESGAHRVQRVPETEAQGRIHTSAATVAVLPEIPENEITINPADLRVDTFRASGAGGQHVNKTDSAIRITHLPTNTVVECDDERSQHKNRARAMSLLAARLADAERERHQKATADARRKLVGSGDRSERIRTYNFPQGRLTDHRINLTLYQLERIVAGDLDPVIGPLTAEHQADLLAADAG